LGAARHEMAKARGQGKACTICQHEKRHLLELGLVHRVPARVLAARFGVSKDALHRHRRNHRGHRRMQGELHEGKDSLLRAR
jgi:hypothetical protein